MIDERMRLAWLQFTLKVIYHKFPSSLFLFFSWKIGNFCNNSRFTTSQITSSIENNHLIMIFSHFIFSVIDVKFRIHLWRRHFSAKTEHPKIVTFKLQLIRIFQTKRDEWNMENGEKKRRKTRFSDQNTRIQITKKPCFWPIQMIKRDQIKVQTISRHIFSIYRQMRKYSFLHWGFFHILVEKRNWFFFHAIWNYIFRDDCVINGNCCNLLLHMGANENLFVYWILNTLKRRMNPAFSLDRDSGIIFFNLK